MLPFTPDPCETEADATGNYQAMDRELKERVYLAVTNEKEGDKNRLRWTLHSGQKQ